MKTLTPKQARFCEEYVIDLCAGKALVRAGFSKRTAVSKASQLLTEPHVQARIKELQDQISKRNELSADKVIQEMMALAFYNVQDLVTANQDIVNIKRADRNKLKPVTGVKVTKIKGGTSVELKLADKLGALMNLGKHLGIFEKDNKQKSTALVSNQYVLPDGTKIDM